MFTLCRTLVGVSGSPTTLTPSFAPLCLSVSGWTTLTVETTASLESLSALKTCAAWKENALVGKIYFLKFIIYTHTHIFCFQVLWRESDRWRTTTSVSSTARSLTSATGTHLTLTPRSATWQLIALLLTRPAGTVSARKSPALTARFRVEIQPEGLKNNLELFIECATQLKWK